MEKDFFSVFPSLQISEELRKQFQNVEIEKLSLKQDRSLLRISICSNRLIHKKYIYSMQDTIREQIFSKFGTRVAILEKYQLSSQYTPETLLSVYEDSIYTELKNYNPILFNLYRKADKIFEDETHLRLVVTKNVIIEELVQELTRILEKVVCERCGLQLLVQVDFKEAEESKLRKNSDYKIRQEVDAIVSRIADAAEAEEQEVEKQPEEKKKEKEPAKEKTFQKGYQKKPFQKGGGEYRGGGLKRGDAPDLLYGRDFDEEALSIAKIEGEIGDITVRGKVLSFDTRDIRNERTIVSFAITDFTDSIMTKLFIRTEDVKELSKSIYPGAFVKIKAVPVLDKFDHELTLGSVWGIKSIKDFTESRLDTAAEKRVELHCHTKMSDMDGVSDVKDIIAQAAAWGHKAIAITDHGNVEAFPVANHSIPKGSDIKVIYGVEAYLVDDTRGLIQNPKGQTLQDTFVVFDIETTGFSPVTCKIIEIGAVKVVGGKIVERFSTFVNPKVPIPYRIQDLTSINDEMVKDAPEIQEVLPQFMEFCGDAIMVAHNAQFDMSFIKKYCKDFDIPCNPTIADTVTLAHFLLPHLKKYKLDNVAKAVNVSLEHHHRAVDDAACTADIFVKFVEMLHARGLDTIEDVNEAAKSSKDDVKKQNTYHAIILATNEIGRVNLYRLISKSHIEYFNKRPRIPKSEFIEHREGLLIGSACEAGELYQAILFGRPEEEIARLVNFYDYLEIQPIGNNAFMVEGPNTDKYPVDTIEDLKEINRKIVKLGEEFHKLVVATCDVHFLNPEDALYRQIIQAGMKYQDADRQAPLYLHTTEEMLKEFEYLGSEKAEEVVITNTNKIADMCERISPVRPDKAPPVIPNSDEMLRKICYTKAHEMYGEELPYVVEERLERELKSIIGNGYAVMYIIAQKLVWKSNEDGYLVGSRGSVGSSFAATMSGITEVNPLHAHYYCEHCHYSDFDSPEVRAFDGRSGCDMPDKICPNCGQPLKKDGFDIPFETFLGFKGDKEPDIDLNFSGDYQAKAHAYTEVIFGYKQTFRAGTIGTLADKTAYGYVKNYFEERGKSKRDCEINRIVGGCVGIRRTTGQHPGGIVVLPVGEDINSFTPIQKPANDMETETVTTHFEYHSIDHNLLKLDILGHDDPTMIRMLEDLTGLNAQEIPLDDKKVMSLFQNTEALGISPDDIGGCKLGALGIPEFGTDFAMGMLIDTNPQEFSDLIRIAGLSHGTDVWLGNAQTLIKEGKATISTAICTRDDIMIYLIGMGLDPEESFKIMENVRKGVIAKGKCDKWPEWKKDMIDHGVPDWYIWSCEKIKYMFPKAHAAAYVMMAWRIAYCKVYYPLAYYAAYFSIRAKGFNYELMCLGEATLKNNIEKYRRMEKEGTLSNKQEDELYCMRIVEEMYARGYEFMPIDIYRGDAKYFQVIDGKLMPSFGSIAGMGENAAFQVQEGAKGGEYLSRDDFRQRTRVNNTVIEKMDEMGLFGDLPASNQLSLFDLV